MHKWEAQYSRTFVNFPLVHSDISFLIINTALHNHCKYIAHMYAILSVCLKKIACLLSTYVF